ncbi:hypothetical protein V0R52_14165 [Pseudomonas asiatica]|uniref:hypothetical protein n=1 Tax=Pseudomonas TaxID=286 RepID=UPI002E7BA090|nr:hypothetical protein [Pseudomonas asiatica]MEE1917543.1 hypothetical protein [Pseudomonas asiatica]
MSLETDVANLVTKTTALIDYFGSKKSGIEAAVAAAIAAIPSANRTWYVNQLTGLDTNDGNTADKPFKTIEKALSSTPVGGLCTALLQADYVMSGTINIQGRVLFLQSDVTDTMRKLTSGYALSPTGLSNLLHSFSGWGGSTVLLRDIEVVLPSATGLNPAPAGTNNSFFRTLDLGASPIFPVKMSNCKVTDTAGATAYMAAATYTAIMFEVYLTTFPSGMAGRYFVGVAAGTAANTVANVMTNLSTL